MRVSRAAVVAAVCVAIGAVAGYPIAESLLPVRQQLSVRLAYSQQRFSKPRAIAIQGEMLHSIRFNSSGGITEATWYDSSVMSTTERAGIYVALYLDGRRVEATLRGEYFARSEAGPATLRWEGKLRAGPHSMAIRADRIGTAWYLPYVEPGYLGIDSLTVTQYSSAN